MLNLLLVFYPKVFREAFNLYIADIASVNECEERD